MDKQDGQSKTCLTNIKSAYYTINIVSDFQSQILAHHKAKELQKL